MTENILIGLTTALTPGNLLYCFIGALLGTLIGVLPGIGPVATIALLLPVTYALEPAGALIMLAGIYYGAQYGGSTTAILINLPGEVSSVVTAIDGYQLARRGRGGVALAVAAWASFFAGTVATVVIVILAPILVKVSLAFGPWDYFALMVLGLVASTVLTGGDLIKAIAMILLGLALGIVGIDINTGGQRLTFGLPDLADGIDFIPLVIGMFGIAEIMRNLSNKFERVSISTDLKSLVLSRADVRAAAWPAARGTLIGSILGVLPGGGAMLASFASYFVERKLTGDPSKFGKGAIEGVAAPEAANNAGAQTSFIPLLSLGIPSNAVMAVMMGAMIIHGIQPGPRIMVEQPQVVWALVASMWLGNAMLLVINLPLVGVWVRLLSVPYRWLFPAIVAFATIGTYATSNSAFSVWLLVGFSALGYGMSRLGFDLAPLVLGFVLGQPLEENLRRALLLSRGDWFALFQQPVAVALLSLTALLLIAMLVPRLRQRREAVFKDDN